MLLTLTSKKKNNKLAEIEGERALFVDVRISCNQEMIKKASASSWIKTASLIKAAKKNPASSSFNPRLKFCMDQNTIIRLPQ